MRHITQDEAPRRIRDRQPFQASALSGVEGDTGTGDLPPDLAELYREHRRSPGVLYTVRSYETPIAWYLDGTWIVPRNRWSVTTTQHQGYVRSALSGRHRGKWVGGEWVREELGHDLFATGEALYVGEDERAVPVGHYEGVGPGYYAS